MFKIYKFRISNLPAYNNMLTFPLLILMLQPRTLYCKDIQQIYEWKNENIQ